MSNTAQALQRVVRKGPSWGHGVYTAVAKQLNLTPAHVRNVAHGLRSSKPVMLALQAEADKRASAAQRQVKSRPDLPNSPQPIGASVLLLAQLERDVDFLRSRIASDRQQLATLKKALHYVQRTANWSPTSNAIPAAAEASNG